MKRFLVLQILLALVLCGCTSAATDEAAPPIETQVENEEADTNGSASVVVKSNALTSEDIAGSYLLTSGSGAWASILTVELDGSFRGSYKNTKLDEVGEGFNGAVYSSSFSGKFSLPQRNPDDSFSMTVTGLKTEETPQTRIENSVKYVYTEPIGMQEGSPVTLFLPGTKVSGLPEEFVNWAKNEYYFEGDELPVVGLMTKKGDAIFGYMRQDD